MDLFKRINIRKKLLREEVGRVGQKHFLLDRVYDFLYEEYCEDLDVRQRIKKSNDKPVAPPPRILRHDRIFREESIRKVAIQYRLRFLDVKHFKAEIPDIAITRLRQLERRAGLRFESFKILAPSDAFRLAHCEEDPLLFVKVGLRTWYLVDQWGNDFKWYRKWLSFPFRNKFSFSLSVFTLAALTSALLPIHTLIDHLTPDEWNIRLAIFTWSFMCLSAGFAFLGFAFVRQLSADQWDSPYIRKSF